MKKKFIPFREFGNIYGQTALNNLYVARCNSTIPIYAFSEDKKVKLVDVNFFIRRKKFQQKVWLDAHDNFFFLTRHLNASELTILIRQIDDTHSEKVWSMFFSFQLFKPISENLLSCKVDGMMMEFYRYSRWLTRALFIKARVRVENRDISVLLDRY